MRVSIVEKDFNYKGFRCKVVFQQLGHRCGYVEIPKGHELFEKDYEDIDVQVHGGLTYANHYVAPEGETENWWIGFDCAHYMDGRDYETAYKLYKDHPEVLSSLKYMEKVDKMFDTNVGEVRTMEYVEGELKSIVDQIIGGYNND